jgi:hypothetical protein
VQRSLCEAFKARKSSQLCCVTYMRPARDHLLQNESEQSYQNLSFTFKMIWWCAFIDAMVNDSYSRLHLWEYAKLHGTQGKCLNSMIIYRNYMRKRIDQLSIRIQLIEGLFVKYAFAVECKVPGRHSSALVRQHSVCLTERHFMSKIPPTAKKSRPQKLCVKNCVLVWRGTMRGMFRN